MTRYVQMTPVLAALLLVTAAEARIVHLRIDRVEPFAGGQEFGATSSYVRISGVAYGELDPADPRNAVIVTLDRAPRNARGLVEDDVDVYLMRPTDASRGNRKLLYDVSNRGRKPSVHGADDPSMLVS